MDFSHWISADLFWLWGFHLHAAENLLSICSFFPESAQNG
jgi:hypothetical protein